MTAASVSATGGMTAAYFTGDGSNVNIGEMTATNIPYVDANKQLRDSHIKNAPDATIINSNLQVTGNIFVSGNSYAITSENTVINDRIIGLANNNTSTTLDVGLMLQYPQKNVAIIHHGTVSGSPHSGQLTVGYTQNTFVEDNVIHDANNITLNVIGHVITQNNITVGAQGSYYGDGTTLTGVALSTDLTNNVTRISDLETATIVSNSSTITTGFTKGDIIYASADNVLNKLAVGGTDGHVLKVTNAANKTLGWAAESGGGSGSGNTPWQTNGNKIHYPTDNVGINVSDPAFKLDVHGTANVGALTATSLSVGGQTLALETDLTANAVRVDALYTAAAGDIIYATATNTLAKLSIGSANQVLTVQGGLPAWVNASGGGGGGGGSSQWSNVTLDEVYFDGNVGIANADPGHDLSVGSNLFVDDDGSNVLVVTGNTAMSSLTLGEVSIVPSYGLNDILNVSNTSSNIMQLTNATTGLVATGNVHALKFIGSGSELTDIASNLDQIVNNGNVTSNTVQFSNATTGLVTTANVEVGGELTVSGNATVSENLTVSGTGALTVPAGTTENRPATAVNGMIRYNSTTGFMEAYSAVGWAPIAQPPTVTGISPLSTLPSGGIGVGWQQEHKFDNSSGLAYDFMGREDPGSAGSCASMSADGTKMIVGVSNYTPSNSPGAAYIYTYSGGSWDTGVKIEASDKQNGDAFGKSVAMNSAGTKVIVGAMQETTTHTKQGAAYIFTYNSGTGNWDQAAGAAGKIVASDAATGNEFGRSVTMSGDGTKVIVGAFSTQNWNIQGFGYYFTWNGTTWSQQQKITSADTNPALTASYPFFFSSCQMNTAGTKFIVGAKGETPSSTSNYGHAYIFTLSGSTWSQEAKLTASDAENDDEFGRIVRMSGDGTKVAVGALLEDEGGTNAGAAYIFTYNSGTSSWDAGTKIVAPDAEANNNFSYGLSINSDGTIVVVGAPQHAYSGDRYGTAYIFTYDGSDWDTGTRINASDRLVGDEFGSMVAIDPSGSKIFVGAGREDDVGGPDGTGSVYSFSYRATELFDASTQVFTATGTGIVSGSTVQLEGADGTLYSVVDATPPNAAGTQVTFKMGGNLPLESPPSAMTNNTSITGYVASASYNSSSAWYAFNDVVTTGSYWAMNVNDATTGYSTSSPYLAGSSAPVTDTHRGHWIQLQIPSPVILTRAVISSTQSSYQHGQFVILGSNDTTNWTLLHTGTGVNGVTSTNVTTLSAGSTEAFSYFRVIIKSKINGTNHNLELNNVEFYSADGTWDLAQQPYKVKINSTSGLIGTSTAAIGFPVGWTTAAGANLNFETTASATQTLVGTDGGGGTNRTFSNVQALPSGLTLTGSTGAITGQIAATGTTSVTFRLTDNATGLFTDRAINIVGESGLYNFTSHTFSSYLTPYVSDPREGPTFAQMKTGYASEIWEENPAWFNSITQGYQIWTIPETGTYRIRARGGRGGKCATGFTYSANLFGRGAEVQADFYFTKNTKIVIIAGRRGEDPQSVSGNSNFGNTGGGGGQPDVYIVSYI